MTVFVAPESNTPHDPLEHVLVARITSNDDPDTDKASENTFGDLPLEDGYALTSSFLGGLTLVWMGDGYFP